VAKKQLRTVKKSNQTGRLNRAEVRSVVIDLRDGRDAEPGVPSASSRRLSARRIPRSVVLNSLIIAA